jgi:hypothetical protein
MPGGSARFASNTVAEHGLSNTTATVFMQPSIDRRSLHCSSDRRNAEAVTDPDG